MQPLVEPPVSSDREEEATRAADQMAEATDRLRDSARKLTDTATPVPAQRRSLAHRRQAAARADEAGDLPATFRTTEHPRYSVLVVGGQLDLYGAPTMRRHLQQMYDAGRNQVIVDLSAVDFMDSSGLSVLVGALKALRERDGTLRVVATSRHIQQLFQVTGLSKVFPIYASVTAAAGEE